MNKCFIGDCRDTMRELIKGGVRVQTCVTSPPYWGLRDYGAEGQLGLEALHDCLGWATGERCDDCHVCRMVEVFRLVRQLLADDGTLWMNYGDSYASQGGPGWQGKNGQRADRRFTASRDSVAMREMGRRAPGNLKPKDLCGVPWRVAFALQSDGWYLRQDIVWHKPNPMPESVTDRCTKAHEYIFLLSKSQRYYFDQDAILEPVSPNTHARVSQDVAAQVGSARAHAGGKTNGNMKAVLRSPKIQDDRSEGIKNNSSFVNSIALHVNERNKRSVWTVPTKPYSGAHFATFPPELIKPCILAGSRSGDIVFDPFFGSGTTGQVSQVLGRQWIGCELNPEYEKLQQNRTAQQGLPI